MTNTPLSCSLSLTEYEAVMDAYAHAATFYTATAKHDETRAVIDLRGPKTRIRAALDDMIAREGQCCPHFQFDVSDLDDGYRVELTAPGAPDLDVRALRQAVRAFFPVAVSD